MINYFCLDVSGSISQDMFERAQQHLYERARIGVDFVVLFDAQPIGLWPVVQVAASYQDVLSLLTALSVPQEMGRGGTSSKGVPELVKSHASSRSLMSRDCYRLVVLTDGFMLEDDMKVFDEFISLLERVH